MSNNELLLAISDMMNTKLKAELQPIRNDLQTVKGSLYAVKDDLQAVKGELHTVKDVLQAVKGELHTVKDKLHLMQLQQETIIMPRLNTIEACYTDTFDRYKNYVDVMDATFEDVDLLKKVVTEHSQRLQKLA